MSPEASPTPERRRKKELVGLGWMGAAAVAMVAVAAGVGAVTCASPGGNVQAPAAAESGESEAPACRVRLGGPAPDAAALGPVSAPASRVAVLLQVESDWLAARLDEKVPHRLASATRKPIGDPGEVTYDVTRGAFAFAVKGDRLVVSTPIAISVEVCKPLGPICPTYGSCEPRLVASASVPLVIGDGYELGKPRASYRMIEGCSIVGFDVSDEIRKIAGDEMEKVQAELEEALPDVKSGAESAVAALAEALPIDGGGCVRGRADKVTQAHPSLDGGTLSWRAAVDGGLELFPEACPPAAEAKLPPIGVGEVPDDGSLAAAVTLPWNALAEGLARSAIGLPITSDGVASDGEAGASEIRALSVRGALLDGPGGKAPALLLEATLEGAMCGDAWLRADVRYDAAARRLQLANVRPLASEPALAGLAKALEDQASMAAPAALGALLGELAGIETRVGEQVRALEGKLGDALPAASVALSPASVTARYGAAGVMFVAERRGRVRVSVK